MKEIINNLKKFIGMHSMAHWLSIVMFCIVTLCVNFTLDVEHGFRKLDERSEFLGFFLMYLLHSAYAYLVYSYFKKDFSIWKKPGFLFLFITASAIFAFRAVANGHYELINQYSSPEFSDINQAVYNDLFRLSYLMVPVTIIWYLMDRQQPVYGFSLKKHHTKIYIILLLLMVPLIIGASFLSDFLDYYPRVGKLDRYAGTAKDKWLFELFYGMDFISIEYFFRGFMVMAFARYVGIYAVLPMAVFYMSIHFGKPLGEAISSFFGGTILGVISFHTGSIFGGIMVHVGIAWLMELGAYIGNWIRDGLK